MNIYETYPVVSSLEKNSKIRDRLFDENKNIKKELNDKKLRIFYALYWALAVPVVAIVVGFVDALTGDTANFAVNWALSFIGALFVPPFNLITGGIALTGFSIWQFIFKNKLSERALSPTEQKKFDDNNAQLLAIETEMRQKRALLAETEVPKTYLCTYALRWMMDAINNKRASSLEEVIPLYEQHVNHMETIKAINDVSFEYHVNVENNYWI